MSNRSCDTCRLQHLCSKFLALSTAMFQTQPLLNLGVSAPITENAARETVFGAVAGACPEFHSVSVPRISSTLTVNGTEYRVKTVTFGPPGDDLLIEAHLQAGSGPLRVFRLYRQDRATLTDGKGNRLTVNEYRL